MRSLVTIVIFLAAAMPVRSQSLQLHGFLTGRAMRASSHETAWIDGGFGRFEAGQNRTVSAGIAQLGVDWTPATWLTVHADGIARTSHSAGTGSEAGVLQAFVDVFNEKWRLRAGSFWLPTSRENIDPLWTSPYSLTYSALNSWIGQEVRPIGADLQYSPNFYLTLGATAFRGNDTMGTLLAARGWTLGNRLSVYNEVVPSPPDTTRPFGPDLDGKTGFAGRIRVQLPERAMLQVTRLDNRAVLDPGAVPDVPWLTRCDIVGTTIGVTSPATFAAEWARGDTTVGFPGGTFTLNFDTIYALVSYKSGANRYTARAEKFDTDFEKSRALTAAYLRDFGQRMRAGAEYSRATGDNPGSTWTVELRLAW
jgi:hypothetical protein